MFRMDIQAKLRARALEIGFTNAGFCRVEEGEGVPRLQEWLDAGMHGSMKYMENPRRRAPGAALPGLRTMIVVTLNYRWPEGADRPQEGMISRYAWGADYHEVMLPMLESLASEVRTLCPGSTAKAYVDTGPVAEKHWAQKAGIGWIGKHTNVLARQGSSWFFLGVVLTDAALEPDMPAVDHCGSCVSCIEACPTRAIVAPYVLDARLCISYLTIELRGSIPRELRPRIGHRIFGCDDCQDVCPWNRFAYAGDPRFTPRPDVLSATLSEYLRLSRDEFRARFSGANVLRAKHRGFLRNCLVAAGNSGRPEMAADVLPHLDSDDDMLREHAAWALGRLGACREELQRRREVETSPAVITELDLALA
jgi:epoxyqueuosine reductase